VLTASDETSLIFFFNGVYVFVAWILGKVVGPTDASLKLLSSLSIHG